jgi:hypothetical protein
MADGSGRISEFSRIYRQRAHENQRIGLNPHSLPRLEEVDDMIKQGERIQMSLQRMRDVVYNHQQASVVEPSQDAHYRRMNGYDHDTSSNYGDDAKLVGGFAGADNKTRKRGVSSFLQHASRPILTTICSAQLRRDDATAAIVPRHRNGAEGPMALGLCATLVVFVSYKPHGYSHLLSNRDQITQS